MENKKLLLKVTVKSVLVVLYIIGLVRIVLM